MSDKNKAPYKLHAIQLVGIKILELSIIVNPEVKIPTVETDFEDAGSFTWEIGYSEYDIDNQQFLLKQPLQWVLKKVLHLSSS